MKRRPTISIFIVSLFLMLTVLLSGCAETFNIKEIRMKDNSIIEISQGNFSYDGVKVVLVYNDGSEKEIDLNEDMIPEVERLKFFKMGEQEVKIVYGSRLNTTMKINVNRKDFEDIYSLVGYTCKYDGLPHKLDLNKELPEGATISYPNGNSFTNVGEYEVKAVISKDGYNPKTLSATLVIEKACHDESNIIFDDLTVVYDGKAKKIEAKNVPDGVLVSYDIYYTGTNIAIKEAKDAGTYKVVAKFESLDNNYQKIQNKEAILTINKAKYDMSKVSLDDYSKTYDGLEYEPRLATGSILPSGVKVEFKCYKNNQLVTSNANAGKYNIVASFKGDEKNYELIDDIKADLTVGKKLVSIKDKVSLEGKTVNYDGEIHSLELVGASSLPEGVKYTISNNDKIYAGEYRVTARFSIENENEELDVKEISAYLIINKVSESVKIYDEEISDYREIKSDDIYFLNNELTVKKLDTEKYKISNIKYFDVELGKTVTELENGKTYEYTIEFSYVDNNLDKSISLSPVSGLITYNE